MSLIEINHVSRFYDNNGKKKYALKDFTYAFPSTGLFAITGKSGCGKSTLLNLIGLLDSPSEGKIVFKKKNLKEYKKKQIERFRNSEISYIYQHYNLLEDHSVMYNVILPLLMRGEKKDAAEQKALMLFKKFDLKKELVFKKASDLSGGEKQRVAIIRAIIGNPSILLCDEPTGALDSKNSAMVMECLKEYSKIKLVICVSHNNELVKKFADKILYIEEGKLKNIETVHCLKDGRIKEVKSSYSYKDKWTSTIFKNNFIKRSKRNLISIASLSIGLVCSFLITGFSFGGLPAVEKEARKLFDYGTMTLSKQETSPLQNSAISIVRMSRPSKDEVNEMKAPLSSFYLEPSIDYLFPTYQEVSVKEEKISLSISPIYSFSDASLNWGLITYGHRPIDSLDYVVINESAYRKINELIKGDCLDETITFHVEKEIPFYYEENSEKYISDYFVFDKCFKIAAVVKETSFLSTPKVYYSYCSFMDYLGGSLLNNLSSYLGEDYSWHQRILECGDGEELSSFSYRIFLKSYLDSDSLIHLNDKLGDNFTSESSSLSIRTAMVGLVQSSLIGLDIFLGITLAGAILIIGIISFSSYTEDRKKCAILVSLGARFESITLIYVLETILIGSLSLIVSFLLSPLLQTIINQLVLSFSNLSNIIQIPFLTFLETPLLFPLIITISVLFASIVSSCLPIFLSSKISLKEELNNDD